VATLFSTLRPELTQKNDLTPTLACFNPPSTKHNLVTTSIFCQIHRIIRTGY
jgi:hypothetical protein